MERTTKRLAALSLFLVAGCSQELPEPERNPRPARPVVVAMVPNGAAIHSVRADASYQTLQWCMKPNPWRGGSVPIGHEQIDIPARTTPTGFEAAAYTDYFTPKSYYPELPACVWSLIAIRFYFSVGPRDFSAMVTQRNGRIEPGTHRLRCFPERPPVETIPDMCMTSKAPMREGEAFFEVLLTAMPAR